MHENIGEPQRAFLVGLDTGEYDAAISLSELEELTQTAGAVVAGQALQKRDKPNPATCVGRGKLAEIESFCKNNGVSLLVFDLELTPTQQRNIERITDLDVIDRTTVILDIFATRAHSSEGKLQVELAQLKYRLPRLAGRGKALSRLGGGIGTRGPGETKLETDRRHIRLRIRHLENALQALGHRRHALRRRRQKEGVETVVIVGYTNAGKSTLMNTLTQAGVLVEDQLFATLDPTARALTLPDGRKVMLIDTVGFIRRLPHDLIEAFQSTLEETLDAELILNVCDAGSEDVFTHLDVTQKLLEELGCKDKPILPVLNKCDLLENKNDLPVVPGSVMISALRDEGIDTLLSAIAAKLPPRRSRLQLLIPFPKAALGAALQRDGTVYKQEYTEQGLFMEVSVDRDMLEQVRPYIFTED